MGKLVASGKSSTSSTGFSSTTFDSDKPKSKGGGLWFQELLGRRAEFLLQMVDKFKPAGRDQWDKLAVQLRPEAES
jgi:hypothetical protein